MRESERESERERGREGGRERGRIRCFGLTKQWGKGPRYIMHAAWSDL